MGKKCVQQLLNYIREHERRAEFEADLTGMLRVHAAELPCRPTRADIAALRVALEETIETLPKSFIIFDAWKVEEGDEPPAVRGDQWIVIGGDAVSGDVVGGKLVLRDDDVRGSEVRGPGEDYDRFRHASGRLDDWDD